jgi:hypothetical protein
MGTLMKKFVIVTASILGVGGVAVAADLPVRQPVPPAPAAGISGFPQIGKAPIGKAPIGKGPIGKGPVGKGPVVAPAVVAPGAPGGIAARG